MWTTKLFKSLDDDEDETVVQTQIPRRAVAGSFSPEELPRRDSESVHSLANQHRPEGQGSLHPPQRPVGSNHEVFGEDKQDKWKYLSRVMPVSDALDITASTTTAFVAKADRAKQWKWILLQTTIPLLLAGCSLIFTGYFLLIIQRTSPFLRWRELTILVTPLLGIKAQLELTSFARFNSHLSLGHIPKPDRLSYCIADVSVSLVQAVLAGICSAYFAMLLVWIAEGLPTRQGNSDIWIILTVSCVSASTTCFLTTVSTMVATLLCFKYKINPNRVAVWIVACIGDISTLGFLDFNARVFQKYEELFWLPPLIMVVIIALSVFFAMIAYRHPFTRPALWACWFPILLVVFLSCFAGMLLEFEGKEFDNMDLYQPLITGISGTIVAIHYSTISEEYFRCSQPGTLPTSPDGQPGTVCIIPTIIFCPKKIQTASYLLLLGITVPAQAVFSLLIWGFVPHHSKNCYGLFLTVYVISCFIESAILLYLSHLLLNFLWKVRIDPGFYVIPCLHGVGDILGTLFLTVCCQIYKINSCSAHS